MPLNTSVKCEQMSGAGVIHVRGYVHALVPCICSMIENSGSSTSWEKYLQKTRARTMDFHKTAPWVSPCIPKLSIIVPTCGPYAAVLL